MIRTTLLFGIIVLVLSVDYCEISKNQSKLFIQKDEVRLVNLKSYIKGFDLTFTSDNPEIA